MGKLIQLVLGTASSALGGIWGYVAVAVFVAGVSGSLTGYVTHRLDTVTLQAVELKDAQAATKVAEQQAKAEEEVAAQQHIIDTQTTVAAVAEATAQVRIVTRTKTVLQEVHDFVPAIIDTRDCISYGLIRLLDSAIDASSGTGTEADYALPPGQSDAACSPVTPSAFGEAIINNIIIPAAANAEQLNSLEATITQEIDEANGPPH